MDRVCDALSLWKQRMTQILPIEECLAFQNLCKWIFGMLERITCKGAKRFELADNAHPALQGRSISPSPGLGRKRKPRRPEQDRQEHADSRVVAGNQPFSLT